MCVSIYVAHYFIVFLIYLATQDSTNETNLLVAEELTVEVLLGANFLDKHKAVLDFAHHRLILGYQLLQNVQSSHTFAPPN